MKRVPIICTAVGALLACLLTPLAVSQKPDKPDVKDFMRGKLSHMEKVLEGITTEDYDLIRKEANQLVLLSHAAEWRVLMTPEKNVDGAALSYVDTTMKCVTCHKYVRSVRMASVPRLPGDSLIAASNRLEPD
jgi:hypothetical protein